VRRTTLSVLLVALALVPACSPKPQAVTKATPPTPPKAPAAPAAAEPTAPTPPIPPAVPTEPAPKPEPTKDGRVVVVDPGDEAANHPQTLVEAARAERERRAHAGEPRAVITNKTLPHSTGQLTYAQPGAKPADAKAKPKKPEKAKAAKGVGETHDEAYWRQRGLDIRQRWRLAADEISKLEQDVADWRRRFYAESDPASRDAQVKPEWDRALDRLQRKKEEVEATQRELEEFQEAGRRAGALPGWLREGADLEPAPPPPPAKPTDAIEPPQLGGPPPP
jgi:hypothetical protein